MSINYTKPRRINYTRPTHQTCLHHLTLTRVQLAGEALRQAGLTTRTADLSQLPACTCR